MDKELFIQFIQEYQKYDAGIRRLEKALGGEGAHCRCELFETDWNIAAQGMLDAFAKSYLTEEGEDLLYWWLYEDVDKIIADSETKEEADVNELENLVDYLWNNKEVYLNE